jgi:hypothetical protein
MGARAVAWQVIGIRTRLFAVAMQLLHYWRNALVGWGVGLWPGLVPQLRSTLFRAVTRWVRPRLRPRALKQQHSPPSAFPSLLLFPPSHPTRIVRQLSSSAGSTDTCSKLLPIGTLPTLQRIARFLAPTRICKFPQATYSHWLFLFLQTVKNTPLESHLFRGLPDPFDRYSLPKSVHLFACSARRV